MNAPTVTSTAPLKAPSLRATLRPLVWEVGLPLLAYFGLRWLGASAFLALLGGSVTALVRVLYVVARTRRVDVFAAFMAVVFGVGVALAFVTGDRSSSSSRSRSAPWSPGSCCSAAACSAGR